MREREPERPRADGGRLQAGGRRSPEANVINLRRFNIS